MSEQDQESDEFYVLPEEAIQFLPEEWRDQLQPVADDGRAVLKSVDIELSQLARLSNSFTALIALKHVQRRLTEYRFSADMDAILDLDLLTTAFVVTYSRLQQGGNASGFSRDALPQSLRNIHDHIIDLRNKRFAHSDEHHTVSNALQVGLKDDCFNIQFELSLGYHIGGAKEWPQLVDFLDNLFAERMDKILEKLKAKTGRDWKLPSGPIPE